MISESWYEVVGTTTKLTQGDLIRDCPLISWRRGAVDKPDQETLKLLTEAVQADVIVVTQACDIEHDKVQNILLCPHFALSEYRNMWEGDLQNSGQNPTEKAWRRHIDAIRDGFIWNLSLLNSFQSLEITTEHRVVDFHEVFTVPRIFLESLLTSRSNLRLRLLPPYREHLSQAFARFFMRVGLPVPIRNVPQA
jgi:hypothetical protein